MWPVHSSGKNVGVLPVVALAGALLCGCGELNPVAPKGDTKTTAKAGADDVSGQTPAELLATIRAVSQEVLAAQTSSSQQAVSDEQKEKIASGVSAADRLLSHPDADADAKRMARTAKLLLLQFGAQRAADVFEQPYGEFVTQLLKDDPKSTDAALGAAGWLEVHHIARAKRGEDLLPLLVDYAKAYPNSPAGIELFQRYGKVLEGRRSRSAAIDCYRAGLAAYGANATTAPLAQRLAELEGAQAGASDHPAEAAMAQRYAKVKSKLGNESGYFVVYAEEQVTARTGLIVWYHYEYEVLHGLPAAVDYDMRLPEKWRWEVVRRFGDTAEGREAAFELRNELIKKKRTGRSSKGSSGKS